jgi:Fur family transcriptional regulator, ferric uptake regulator
MSVQYVYDGLRLGVGRSAVQDETIDMLRTGNRRVGRARRQITEFLAQHDGPVTGDDIVGHLPDIHASSVYRALNVLEELGYIRHVHLAHGAALYELADEMAAVRHLVCEVCGDATEIPSDLLDPLRRTLEAQYGFVLDSGHFALTGHCATCPRSSSRPH